MRSLIDRLRISQWRLGIDVVREEEFVPLMEIDGGRPDRIRADPFFRLMKDGTLEIFCECMDTGTARGAIERLRIRDGQVHEASVVIEAPHHLSFPYLFEQEGVWRIMPESAAARELVLYDENDDGEWHRGLTLLDDVAALDACLFQQGGLFWLWFTDQDYGRDNNLMLHWAECLAGPWHSHPANPILSEPAMSRSAGPPENLADGQLLLRTQDSRAHYGHAIIERVVETLTPDQFSVRTIGRLKASSLGRDAEGLHTLSIHDGYRVYDLKQRQIRADAIAMKIRRRLGR